MTVEAASTGERSLSVFLYVLSGVGIVAAALVIIALVGAATRRDELRQRHARRTVEEAGEAAEWVLLVRQGLSSRAPSDLADGGNLAGIRAKATSLTVGQLLTVPEALMTVRDAFARRREPA